MFHFFPIIGDLDPSVGWLVDSKTKVAMVGIQAFFTDQVGIMDKYGGYEGKYYQDGLHRHFVSRNEGVFPSGKQQYQHWKPNQQHKPQHLSQ